MLKYVIKFFYTETPPAPVNPRYEQFSANSVTVAWESNSSCILMYNLRNDCILNGSVTYTVGNITDLKNGTCYNNISVSAVNSVDEGPKAVFDEMCMKGKF